ncbi:hypothetical protein, partial [Nocardioides psychrotolerans]
MATNDEVRWPVSPILVTVDDAHGPFVITEHDAVILNQRGAQQGAREDDGDCSAREGPLSLTRIVSSAKYLLHTGGL